MLQGKQAILFDLDGSLVDSMWVWKSIDIEYLGRFGLTIPEDLQKCIEGMSFSETAVYFKERFSLPCTLDEIKADWNQMAWDNYRTKVMLKPGAEELLKYSKEHGIKLGIATSNSREIVEMTMRERGVIDYFSCIMTGCDAKKGKPAPDVYLMAAEQLDVEPSKCLVFEDIPNGITAGKNAGMTTCAVYDDFSKHMDDEKKKLADYYINGYEEITANNFSL